MDLESCLINEATSKQEYRARGTGALHQTTTDNVTRETLGLIYTPEEHA